MQVVITIYINYLEAVPIIGIESLTFWSWVVEELKIIRWLYAETEESVLLGSGSVILHSFVKSRLLEASEG